MTLISALWEISHTHAPANLDRTGLGTGAHGQGTQHPDMMSPSHPDRLDITLSYILKQGFSRQSRHLARVRNTTR